MKVSYVSDIHGDFQAPFHINSVKWKNRTLAFVDGLIGKDQTDKEVLIVAGDLSHFNKQSYWMLEAFSKAYGSVFFTLGNHDFYLVSDNQSRKYKQRSLNRVNELLTMIEPLENVKALIGFEKHFITDDITIAGDTFWYPLETLEQKAFFHNVSNDSQLIKNVDISLEHEYAMQNYNNLDAATILVTHIPPITINSHHQYNSTCCYMTPVTELKTTHWVFGHCHEQNVYEKPYGNFYINSIGYENEFKNWYSNAVLASLEEWEQIYENWYSIKSFEV